MLRCGKQSVNALYSGMCEQQSVTITVSNAVMWKAICECIVQRGVTTAV